MGDELIIKINPTENSIVQVNLEPGVIHFVNALHLANPGMETKDLEVIGNAYLHNLAVSIENKLPVGNLTPKPDGRVELHTWDTKQMGID